jgi:predicted porin
MNQLHGRLCCATMTSATLVGCALGPAPPLLPAPTPPREDRIGYLPPRYAPSHEANAVSYATLYGRLAVGYKRTAERACRESLCQLDTDQGEHTISKTRSYLGVRGTETLSGGLAAHFRLEATLQPATGKVRIFNAPLFDGGSTVGLSDRDKGRIDLGLRDQPAWRIALAADPWSDSSVGSPGSRLYGPAGGTRTPGSLTYASPPDRDVQVELQAGRAWCNGIPSDSEPGTAPAPVLDRCSKRKELGASIRYARGAWYAGLGWQRWADAAYAVPIALNYDAGGFKLYAGATAGRAPWASGSEPRFPSTPPLPELPPLEATRYSSVFIGATMPVMAKGDPRRQEWAIGLSSFNPAGMRGDTKFGIGWRYRFSPRSSFHVDAAVVRSDGGARREGLEVGFVHNFGRDLRYPL